MKLKVRLALGLALALCVLGAAAGSAQTALGSLRGSVLDQQGGTLPGVAVTARHVATNTVQTTVTAAEGRYLLANLPPGAYEVTTELSGFRPLKEQLELRVGQDLTVNFTMKLADIAETVVVVGSSVTVQTQSTLSTVITNKQIDELPTVGRNF